MHPVAAGGRGGADGVRTELKRGSAVAAVQERVPSEQIARRPGGDLPRRPVSDYKPGVRVPYGLVCTALGLAIAWLPLLVHGPIAEKFDTVRINGAIAVWAFYGARMLIGFLVGITRWPAQG